MRVICICIEFEPPASAVLRFHTEASDGEKAEKGMTHIAMPLEKANTYRVGEEYELQAPHVRPKVVKLEATAEHKAKRKK